MRSQLQFRNLVPGFGAGIWRSNPEQVPAEREAYEVANIAATAAAMTAVATQPRPLTHPVTTKSPMTFGAAASHIMIAMTGTATTPLITALQYSARIGSMGEIHTAQYPDPAERLHRRKPIRAMVTRSVPTLELLPPLRVSTIQNRRLKWALEKVHFFG